MITHKKLLEIITNNAHTWDKSNAEQDQAYIWVDDLISEIQEEFKTLTSPVIMPRISHFIDENGTNVDLKAEGVNVRFKRDGSHEYFRSFGFAGRKELTPVYGV